VGKTLVAANLAAALARAGQRVLVLDADLGLANLDVVLNLAARPIRLLVNQAQRKGEGRTVRSQLQQVVDRFVNPTLAAPMKLQLVGEVPLDPAVRDAVLRRQLLMESAPGCPAAVAMAAAAAKLLPP
jgi:MinD-like ATPase involved in chromosome partitioning or flagellar assembly